MGRTFLMIFTLFVMLAVAVPATARHEAEHYYRYEQVWGTAVRLIRVDMGFPIREKDQDIGFIVFDYLDSDGSKSPGSVEVLNPREGRREGVRVVIKTPKQPGYVEIRLLDKLKRKLYQEHGEPVEPAPERDPKEDENPDSDSGPDDKNEDKAKH